MLAPVTLDTDATGQRKEIRDEALRIRAKYQVSGLYRNDGSTTPLWTVDWYAHSVFVFSDGNHLVREGPWATSSSDEALTFFSSGKEIRSYKIKDLEDLPWLLPHTVSHFRWLKTADVNDSDRTLTVVTFLWDKYVFDAATGGIVSSRRPTRLALGALALIVVIAVLLLLKRARRRDVVA